MKEIEFDVPVVVAFTPNYLVPVATCLLSVLDNSDSSDSFHFICLLTKELSDRHQQELKKLIGERSQFSFIDLSGELNDIYVDEKYTVAASYRLLLPDLLPDYDKVLYIDCDMVFRNNLAELYRQTDITEYYMAGVVEATLPFQLKHMQDIGCEPGSYINSGLLLMNLTLLRKDNMVERFLEASKVEGLEFPDQDVINQLCKGQILGLEPYWNSIRTFLLPQYKIDFLKFYTASDWKQVQERGNVHYTGPKPWHTFTVAFDLWWGYYEKLPRYFKELIPIPAKINLLARVYRTTLGKLILDSAKAFYRIFKLKVG
ncbi:glycosyltransferase family 8 protein [Sphingobacterium sp. LRF_L2]|uniref:glycosyltransferase family 8 protein n=1 Tax=Sphingobacterium sp. LRF_L2 TaxID=3369421 RepID=UPI003F5D6684